MKLTACKKHHMPPVLRTTGESGQSTIEYLIVTFALVAALISMPSIFETMSATMKNKYHSYSFAIAISDPPRKAFDDEVQKDADKIQHILDVFEEIEDLMKESVFPELLDMKLPQWSDIEKFGKLIKSIF